MKELRKVSKNDKDQRRNDEDTKIIRSDCKLQSQNQSRD